VGYNSGLAALLRPSNSTSGEIAWKTHEKVEILGLQRGGCFCKPAFLVKRNLQVGSLEAFRRLKFESSMIHWFWCLKRVNHSLCLQICHKSSPTETSASPVPPMYYQKKKTTTHIITCIFPRTSLLASLLASLTQPSSNIHSQPQITTTDMCHTVLYKSRDKKKGCDHRWLVIDQPCAPGRGFSNCAIFKGRRGTLAPAPRCYWATKEDCPWHGLKGKYDYNLTRVIENIDYHVFGVPGGPSCCIVQ